MDIVPTIAATSPAHVEEEALVPRCFRPTPPQETASVLLMPVRVAGCDSIVGGLLPDCHVDCDNSWITGFHMIGCTVSKLVLRPSIPTMVAVHVSSNSSGAIKLDYVYHLV